MCTSSISGTPFPFAPVNGLSNGLSPPRALVEDVLLVVLQLFPYVPSLFSFVDILSTSPWGQTKKEELAVTSEQEEGGQARASLGWEHGPARGWVGGWVTPSSWPPLPECFLLAR